MSSQQAIAMIETCGMPAALVLADALNKAAEVQVIGIENIAAGRISVIIQGHIGAVKAALSTARTTASTHPGIAVLSHHIVPRAEGFTNIHPLMMRHHSQTQAADEVTWLDG